MNLYNRCYTDQPVECWMKHDWRDWIVVHCSFLRTLLDHPLLSQLCSSKFIQLLYFYHVWLGSLKMFIFRSVSIIRVSIPSTENLNKSCFLETCSNNPNSFDFSCKIVGEKKTLIFEKEKIINFFFILTNVLCPWKKIWLLFLVADSQIQFHTTPSMISGKKSWWILIFHFGFSVDTLIMNSYTIMCYWRTWKF